MLSLLMCFALAGPPPPPPPPPTRSAEPEPEPEPEPDDSFLPGQTDVEPDLEPEPEPEPTPEPKPEPTDVKAKKDETPPWQADDKPDAKRWKPWPSLCRSRYLCISGYVQPQYTFLVRPQARPRDQREFGAGQTRAGIVFTGEPIDRFTYDIHLVIGAQIVNAVTGVETVDENGDGFIDDVSTRSEPTPGLFIERLRVGYRPVDYKQGDKSMVALDLYLGQLRIPWTAQNRSLNSNLLFPRRSAANNVFLFGTDLGGLVELDIIEDRVELAGGVFNGTGVAVGRSNERGALYAVRLDVNPLGGFPFNEGDLERGKFRFGVGSGLLYFPSRLYDDSGNDTRTRARDLRASASVRMAVKGFYLQGEFLRRQRTDSLSDLPFIATGAYGQTSYYVPVHKQRRIGLAPLGRFGWFDLDQSFDPRTTYFAEAGVALYLGSVIRPDAMRVLVQYIGEWRATEQEQAHGAALQAQLKF